MSHRKVASLVFDSSADKNLVTLKFENTIDRAKRRRE
jgi:hypothetical protein